MTARTHSVVVSDFLDACTSDVEEGGRDWLHATVARIDAELVASMASGPTLFALARSLRVDAERTLARLDAERAALAAARAASPSRLLAALRWRRADWLSEFRLKEIS